MPFNFWFGFKQQGALAGYRKEGGDNPLMMYFSGSLHVEESPQRIYVPLPTFLRSCQVILSTEIFYFRSGKYFFAPLTLHVLDDNGTLVLLASGIALNLVFSIHADDIFTNCPFY